jgi:ribonuclease HI
MAGITAVQKVLAIRKGRMKVVNQVVIKADSEYLVKGMTEWIFTWEQNGFLNARGQAVTNARYFQLLQSLVWELNDLGVEVLFWWVPRERNRHADALANMAFDGE